MVSLLKLRFSRVPPQCHLKPLGSSQQVTAYCTEMVSEKVHFTPQAFGKTTRADSRPSRLLPERGAGLSLVWRSAQLPILRSRRAAAEFLSQSTGSSQGICWAALAMV